MLQKIIDINISHNYFNNQGRHPKNDLINNKYLSGGGKAYDATINYGFIYSGRRNNTNNKYGRAY